jgi:hypothetical protein
MAPSKSGVCEGWPYSAAIRQFTSSDQIPYFTLHFISGQKADAWLTALATIRKPWRGGEAWKQKGTPREIRITIPAQVQTRQSPNRSPSDPRFTNQSL